MKHTNNQKSETLTYGPGMASVWHPYGNLSATNHDPKINRSALLQQCLTAAPRFHLQAGLVAGAVFALFIMTATQLAAQEAELTGCKPIVAIHTKSCELDLYYRCDGAQGTILRNLTYSSEGLTAITSTDEELMVLDVYLPESDLYLTPVEPNRDSIQLSEFLNTGRDQFDFSVAGELNGRSLHVNYQGWSISTENTRTIDGVLLLETSYRITRTIGTGLNKRTEVTEGKQYYSKEFNSVFRGTDVVRDGSGTETTDHSPARISRPGELAFSFKTPLYGCGNEV